MVLETELALARDAAFSSGCTKVLASTVMEWAAMVCTEPAL